jgi:hypothetical protein
MTAEFMELRQDLHQIACSVLAHVEIRENVPGVKPQLARTSLQSFFNDRPLRE